MNTRQIRMVWCFTAVAFLAGVACGLFVADQRVSAADKFGADITKSDSTKAFVEGGDRNYALLKEIQTLVAANSKHLETIDASAQSIAATVKTIPGKLDAFGGRAAAAQK